jgi:hypothetical protein
VVRARDREDPFDLTTIRSRSVPTAVAAAIRAHRSARPASPSPVWFRSRPVLAMHDCAVALGRPSTLTRGRGRYVISTPSAPLDGRALAAPEGATAVELPTGDDRARVWMIQ